MKLGRRSAFTLIEVMIVVVIMAILAGTIIPRMSNTTDDAKEALLRHHLRTFRMQIEVYKVQHNGKLPTGFSQLNQLTKATNAAGVVGPTNQPTATHPLGPYLPRIPDQPFSGSNHVQLITGAATPSFTAAPGNGWIYQFGTGKLWVDHADYSDW